MRNCPKCGEEIPENWKFHAECGWKENDKNPKGKQVKLKTTDDRITRIACIRSACLVLQNTNPSTDTIRTYAEDFYKWVNE